MTANDLLQAYSRCRYAVAWCELFADGNSDDGLNGFEVLRREKATLDEATICLIAAVKENDGLLDPMIERHVIEEMKSVPSFRTYLAAKLGYL